MFYSFLLTGQCVDDGTFDLVVKKAGTCTRADLTALIAKWESSRHGLMHEYREVALYYLNKKLSRMNASA